MRMSGRVMTLAWGVGMAWTGAAGLLWSKSGPAPAGAIDKSHVRPATDEELRAVVGRCPICCTDLGLCNGWEGPLPCTIDPQTGGCLHDGAGCNGCTPVSTVFVCAQWNAVPGDRCTPLPSIPCNRFEPAYDCITVAGGCECKSVWPLIRRCGRAGQCRGSPC